MLVWLTHPEGDRHTMMQDVERLAGQELVTSLLGIDLDTQSSAAISNAERQPGKWRKQARRKGKDIPVIAQATKTGDRDEPGASQRGKVQAPSSVGSQITQIGESCLAEVVVRQLEVTDFGGNDCLNGRRERRVAHRYGLVVDETAGLCSSINRSPHRYSAKTRSACLTT
jgi:hypothetical protein